ncbi:MAG: hypothetical protein QM811_21135 [Pirellulales bacterium]
MLRRSATAHGFTLLAGEGHSGKTTAALACAKAGWRYAGDDFVAVNSETGRDRAAVLLRTAAPCSRRYLQEFHRRNHTGLGLQRRAASLS